MAKLGPCSILGPGGAIARRLPSYELRSRAARDGAGGRPRDRAAGAPDRRGRHGRGQELCLPRALDPGGRRAEEEDRRLDAHHRLQEQLLQQGHPVPAIGDAAGILGRPGQGSVQLHQPARLDVAWRGHTTFQRQEEFDQLGEVRIWANRTNDGCRPTSISGLSRRLGRCRRARTAIAWAATARGTRNASIYQARRRVWSANLLIVNHALFVSDLALRRRASASLPNYDVVIFDEAHTLEAVAGEHLGLQISNIGRRSHAGPAVQRAQRQGTACVS